ncbi:MAG: hypothetical protein JWP06_925 [Candidatus Saccharibacteria bacterium]|nr:hypothetical protein [Candidatus Saccharibacteria bacterium]
MNIAHLLPYTAQFPLVKHNGRYEWALRLARIQAQQGHTVSVYAAPGSHDESPIVWRSIEAPFKDKTTNNIALIKEAFQNREHDIYHSHLDYMHYFLADMTTKPVVATQHWFPDTLTAAAATFNTTANVTAVPVTNYMLQEDVKLGIKTGELIYHGIDLSLFHPSPLAIRERFIFVGRITERKGVREAVKYATLAGVGLDIIGKINDVDQPYWQSILPYVDGVKIKYLGPQSQTAVAGLVAQAKGFLFPTQSQEPFGQVTIEAQAAGTPVIIGDIGASNELVQHGKTGFVCSSEQDYIDALHNINDIRRTDCREFAERFDLKTMINNYDTLYRLLTDTSSVVNR